MQTVESRAANGWLLFAMERFEFIPAISGSIANPAEMHSLLATTRFDLVLEEYEVSFQDACSLVCEDSCYGKEYRLSHIN